jgi:hypothetical protein
MPDGVKSIGAGAFCNSTGLTTVNIPDSVTEIGDYAFSGCLGLTVSRIPEKITIINKGTFENCTALTSLYIPKGLQTISRYALNGCSALTVIFYGGTDNSMWQSISVGASNSLLHTRTYYYSEIRRADGGYYWHYIDGVPTVW